MRLRQKEVVIRTHRYSENDFRYFYLRLLLFLLWRNEDELMGEYSTYEEHYNAKLNTIEENAQKYNMDRSDVEEALENYMANPPEMSEWLAAGVNENDNVEEFLDNKFTGLCRVVKIFVKRSTVHASSFIVLNVFAKGLTKNCQ